MLSRSVIGVLGCVFCLACDKKKDASDPIPAPTSNNESVKPKPTKDRAEDKPELEEPKMATKSKRPKTKKETLKAFYGHLQAGQKAVRAKKYDDGIAERGEPELESDTLIYDWDEREVKHLTVVSFDGPSPKFVFSAKGATDIELDGQKVLVTTGDKTTSHLLKDLNRCPDVI